MYSVFILPLACAFLIALLGKKARVAGGVIASLASAALFTISLNFAVLTISQKILICRTERWIPPYGISLVADQFSVFMMALANLITFIVSVYSVAYVRPYTDKWKYFSLLMLMAAGVNGVLVTGDLFNLFVFLEIASIAAYCMVTYTLHPESFEAAFKYAVMSTVASCFILLGIAFLYAHTSTLNMADMAAVLAAGGHSKLTLFVSVLFVMGFGMKAAAVPFHAWLPDAYTKSPATLPAMSSGVLLKVLGIYALSRVFFNVMGMTGAVSTVLTAIAVLTMVAGSLMAFGQTNMRRLFGYSSISQIGYIILGLAVGTPLALLGSVFHIFNHSVAKSLLFLNAGAVEDSYGTGDLRKISGIFCRSKLQGSSQLLGAMSICGIPPLAGFWSKAIIIFACIQAGRYAAGFIAAAVSIFTLAYYLKALTPALFGEAPDGQSGPRVALPSGAAMAALSALVLFGGVLMLPGVTSAIFNGAAAVLSDGIGYAYAVFGALR
jgi:multicomponent Na+:H+ antiporter subunit D